MSLQPFFQQDICGITILQMTWAFFAILGGFILRGISNLIFRRLIRLAEQTNNLYDDIILEALKKPVGAVSIVLGIWGALVILPLPEEPFDFNKLTFELLKAAIIAVAFWLGVRFVNGFGRYFEDKAREDNPHLAGFLPIGRKTVAVFLCILGGLIIVQNLGYSVTSLLAGLGIGGVAVALAAKDTLANIFGSIVIFVDRPFHVGDWVKVGGVEGTVEEVGLRVTRIRTFPRSLVTIPNSQLTTLPIENWSAMEKRRIKFAISLASNTGTANIQKAVETIRRMLEQDNRFLPENNGVFLDSINTSAVEILVVAFTKTTDYNDYMTAKHDLLLKIRLEFDKFGIEMSSPTQVVAAVSSPKPQ